MTLEAIRKNTLQEARAYAIEQSLIYPEQFFYVKFHTSGFYLVDFLGIMYNNETLVETFKNGDLEYVELLLNKKIKYLFVYIERIDLL